MPQAQCKLLLTYASHSDTSYVPSIAQQAIYATTHDDEDLLQIDEDAMEEIDIRWQVAMITARIRKLRGKTGRPIDLKPKNGITFDKSKIECFNCQKLGHFARECRFAKYQENRANGRQEKKEIPDWSLTEVEQDDWSMEFDAEHVHFGQDGLGDFDWSNKADDTPVSLALMATNSEVPYCSKCSKSYKKLLESYQTERDNFQKARTEILGYQMSLESLEVILKTHEKNEYAWGDKYEQMEYDLKMRDLKLEEKQKELDQALRERDDFKVKLEKWSNAAVLQNEVLNKQRYLSDKTCIGFGVENSSSEENNNSSGDETLVDPLYENFKRENAYKAVPPPTGTIIPPRANVSFTGIDELAIRNKVVNQEKTKTSQPEIDRNKVIIEDWVDSDDEETDFSEIQKKTVFNSENSETSFENKSPKSQNSVGQESRTTGLGNKGGKLCFVCYSPDHLIKDCNLHDRTFKQTQTHKPKGTQGSRDTRPVWNKINRVNHSNFSRNSRYPHQRRSFIPSAVLTREGLKSTARPSKTQTVPSKSTANVFYQGTARPVHGWSCKDKMENMDQLVREMEYSQWSTYQPDIICYNLLIDAFGQKSYADKAESTYLNLLEAGCIPTEILMHFLLRAYCKCGLLEKAEAVFMEMRKYDLSPSEFKPSAIVSEKAEEIFEKLHEAGIEPDVYPYNALMEAYSRAGFPYGAAEIFSLMQHMGCEPDRASFNIMVDAYGRSGLHEGKTSY
ncbi:ribonuclease H-like domain-containing protein [Tanacetum coccineum]